MNMKIGQTGDALYPEIYPDLVSSTDFIVGLFPVKVTTKKHDISCDYYTYLTKHNKPALTDYPFIGLKKFIESFGSKDKREGSVKRFKTPLWLTKDEDAIAKTILHNIKCLVDKKQML